jgi:hypothetical protein
MNENGPSDEVAIATPAPVAAVGALTVFQWISAAAGLIAALKSIFEDHAGINEQLEEILTELQELQQQVILATAEILEAIDGIHRQINEKTARDSITDADVALFNDLAVFDDKQAAMSNSFRGADRLVQETEASFATAFMYVVNIRLAVLKEFDPNYFCVEQFVEEFQRYGERLEGWIDELNRLIARSHTVSVVELIVITPGGTEITQGLEGRHLRNGIVVRSRRGPRGDTSEATFNRLLEEMNRSRASGISADRRQFGVVEMEATAKAWQQAFDANRRAALVSQVLSRPAMAIDANPGGLMVDGRLLPDGMDLRSTLYELLTSREFRRRLEHDWKRFVDGADDRLAEFALRRLCARDANQDEVALLRRIAATYGYGAFLAVLLHSREYEERYGRGLPPGGTPVLQAIERLGPATEEGAAKPPGSAA